jgi:hypothetical protein
MARLISLVERTQSERRRAVGIFATARTAIGFQLAACAKWWDATTVLMSCAKFLQKTCYLTGTNLCTRSPPNTSPV